MSSTEIVLDHEIDAVLKVVEQRTIAFMREQLGLSVTQIDRRLLHDETVILRDG